MIELLDVKQDVEPPANIQEHLAGCPRCQTHLARLPDEQLEAPEAAELPAPHRWEQVTTPTQVASGQLWIVQVDPDWSEVVAVLGHSPETDSHLLVAPVVSEPSQATEQDLLLDRNLLGYDCFADVGNAGMVTRTALASYRASLAAVDTQALVGLYRHMMGAEGEAPQAATGVPVMQADDPRLLAAEQRTERFRALWREVLATVDMDHALDAAEEVEEAPATVSAFLASHLEGDKWDRSSLLEASHVDPANLDRFLRNELDLTHRHDTSDLAKVLKPLHPHPRRLEPVVIATLQASAGGQPYSDTTPARAAARSRPGQSQDEVAMRLFQGSVRVDRTASARQNQIKAYLAELWQAVDDLS